MDISKASNFERFVYDLVGRDGAKTRALWAKVDAGNSFDLNAEGYFAKIADYGFQSGSSSHADRMKTIRETADKYQVIVDTHTADGIKVALELRDVNVPMVVLETALPAKFEDSIVEALGKAPERPAALNNIESLPQRFDVMDFDTAAIKQYIMDKTS
jgi:threonine synthase